MELIKREQVPTETGRRLYDKLVEIWADGEFVYFTLALLSGDERKQKMIDYIEKYEITDSSDVTLLSLDILDGVEPELNDEE